MVSKVFFPYWSIHHSCNLFMKQYESIGTLPIPCFFSHCLFDLKIVMILRKQTIAFLRHIAISPCPDCLAIYKFIIHPNTITQIVTPAQWHYGSYRPFPAVRAHKCQLSPADEAHDCQPASPPSNVSTVHSPTDHTNCSRSGNLPTQVKLSPGPTDG